MINYIAVVNTINRSTEFVERALKSILAQDFLPSKIFLIDQNLKPLILPDDIVNNKIIEVINVHTKSISIARNSITIPQDVEYIFFCDDDGFADKNFSKVLFEIIKKNPELDLFGGACLNETDKKYYSKRQKMKGGIKGFADTKKIMGSNLVVRAKLFEELKRFSSDFGVGSFWGAAEETDLVWKAFFNKNKIDFFHELIIYHPPILNNSISDEIKKSFRYGFGKGGLVAKWLFKEKKIVVIYELVEMIAVPFYNIIIGFFTLNIKKILSAFSSITGRVIGLIRGLFYKFS